MTLVHVAVMTAILLAAMASSMLYYGSRGKKKMRTLFDAVSAQLGGQVRQKNRLHYPHLAAEVDGRPVEMFFHLSEGHRRTSDIVYLVLSTPISLPAPTLVVQEGFFAASAGKGAFNDVAGDYLADLMPGHYIYATDEAHTASLFEDGELAKALASLNRYANIVLGPDAITVGKPYGGALDLVPERIVGDFEKLVALARLLDRKPAPATKKAAATA